ncbi:nucleophile aminohydrolase [Zychaea mexicana]|uniref:nucleophile aminohydrolase n=1 Tax=Zychaea mexicana TaxID=64656 RepID=UPI0022FE08C7|nr:nucleophile aminohydrolase [Zychaea mexicana]KAI9495243.1 nucleophile aminohydrolase [Zychaea mexicana]
MNSEDIAANEPLLPKPISTTQGGNRRKHKLLIVLGITAAALLLITGVAVTTLKGRPQSAGRLVTGKRAAVAVEAEECSNTGVEILKQGGNAVDAAIASALCIGVIDSFATGGFMLIRAPNGTFEFVDFRETAPLASDRDMFIDDSKAAQVGGLAVGVPGEVRGFELAHKRHGKLPWATLFEPAIRIARYGFRATPLLETRLKTAESWLMTMPEWTEVFAPNETLAKAGDLIVRSKLAETLDTIAREGPDAFYTGYIAESLVNATQAAGGIMTMEDMETYKAVIRPTVSTYYHGRKVTTCTTPTSGPLIASVLNILERYNFPVHGMDGLNIHRFVEAMKYGFAFRTEFGDPDFVDNDERILEIATKEWANIVRRNISDDTTHPPLYYQPKFDHISSHGTMHLSVVDEDNGAVALTSTVNLLFGAQILDQATGVILNDEMDDFSIPGKPNKFGLYPSEYNYVAPGKRPLSSITPTIIERDSQFEMALGGSGGSLIPTATLSTFILGENQRVSAVQAVRRLPDGTVHAASDPRKLGLAAAY